MGSYDGRYAQYYKVIKEKYPQLQLIATAPVQSIKAESDAKIISLSAQAQPRRTPWPN